MDYIFESMPVVGGEQFWVWRTRDGARHNLLAVCSVRENAEETVKAYKRAALAPHLALALESLRRAAPYVSCDHKTNVLAEADRALDDWKQLTKT